LSELFQVPFVNKSVEFKDWPKLKPNTPLGSLPILEVEQPGKPKRVVPESNAILRYVGKLGGLYPSDPVQALEVDSFIDTASDATKKIEMSIQGAVKTLVAEKEWTDDEKLAFRKRIAEDEKSGLPFHLSYFETSLARSESGYLVGDRVTVADLQLYRITSWLRKGIIEGISKDILFDYPRVQAHYEKIESLPEVQVWRSKHAEPYPTFDFSPTTA